MELAVFATRIHGGWKIGQERRVELATREFAWQRTRVDTSDPGSQSPCDHLGSESICRNPPDREERLETRALKLAFAIRANVGEEQVAECDGVHSLRRRALEHAEHDPLVIVVRTRPR